MTRIRRSLWTRWIFFLCATIVNLGLIYALVPQDSQKLVLIFLAVTVAVTGAIVLALQGRARRTFTGVLKNTEIPGWGPAAVFYHPITESTARMHIHNLGVWRREGHEIWIQRRVPRKGLGKPQTVITAVLKPAFPGSVRVSRKAVSIEEFMTARKHKQADPTRSFSVKSVPESALRELLDTQTWKAIAKLAALEDPLHQFYVSWRSKTLEVSLEGELEDAQATKVFLEMSFRIIDRLIDLGVKNEKHTVPAFSRKITTVRPDTTILAAAEIMKTDNLGSVIVSEDKKVPLGILTERDLCRRVVAQLVNPAETPVWKVMSQKISSIKATDPIEKAYAVLAGGQIRHVPVLDGHKVAGMISLTDLFERLYLRWGETAGNDRGKPKLLCDVFSREVVTISPTASIPEAAKLMAEHNIGSLVLTEKGGDFPDLKGIVTERDFCHRVVAGKLAYENVPISRVATAKVVSISAAEPLEKAFEIFGQGHFRHLPVHDKKKIVGVFSIADMVKFLQQALAAA